MQGVHKTPLLILFCPKQVAQTNSNNNSNDEYYHAMVDTKYRYLFLQTINSKHLFKLEIIAKCGYHYKQLTLDIKLWFLKSNNLENIMVTTFNRSIACKQQTQRKWSTTRDMK